MTYRPKGRSVQCAASSFQPKDRGTLTEPGRARGNEEAKCDLGRRATDDHFWGIAMDFVLSKHAEVSAEEREIPLEWIRQTLKEADLREADRRETGVELFYARIAACGNRVLKVVVNVQVDPWRVMSVYFDRSMKERL